MSKCKLARDLPSAFLRVFLAAAAALMVATLVVTTALAATGAVVVEIHLGVTTVSTPILAAFDVASELVSIY